jgi:methanogenic corrinoid protein MtbC1
MLESLIKAYNAALFDTDRDGALKIVHNAVKKGISPEDVVFKIIVPSIDFLAELAHKGSEINLAHHFMAAQIAEQATEAMLCKFENSPQLIGHVIMGTSQGDFHGLGKRIVIGCLKILMIGVTDIGLNVEPERFVDEAVAHDAEVIGISSMMVHTARGENGCLKVRQILKERKLEDKIRIAVGGAPYRYDHDLWKTVQADGWAENGIEAGKMIMNLIKEARR